MGYTSADVFKQIESAALSESSAAVDEGDYIRANYIGYNYSGSIYYNQISYSVAMIYASTAEQENQVNAVLQGTLASLALNGKSDYDKIKAINDYIVDHITYTNDGTGECHSTYAALVKGKAVCQGYESLFYRLCRESGIAVRYILGMPVELLMHGIL